MRFFGFTGRKPSYGHSIDLDHVAAYPMRTPILPNLNQGVEEARPVSHCTFCNVAPLLYDYSGLLPILGHVIGLSRRRRRGSGVRRFGAKETQPICLKGEVRLLAAAIINNRK